MPHGETHYPCMVTAKLGISSHATTRLSSSTPRSHAAIAMAFHRSSHPWLPALSADCCGDAALSAKTLRELRDTSAYDPPFTH